MTVEVSIASIEDIAEISAMFERSYSVLLAPDYEGALLRVALPIMGRARPDLVTSGRFFVVRDGARLLGAGGWSLHAPGNPNDVSHAHVRHVATDPSAARMGVGSALLQAIFEQAKAENVPRLMAYSTLTAEAFYARHGIQKRRDITVPLGGKIMFPCVEMITEL